MNLQKNRSTSRRLLNAIIRCFIVIIATIRNHDSTLMKAAHFSNQNHYPLALVIPTQEIQALYRCHRAKEQLPCREFS